jgi:hypothetical protein
MISLNFQQLDEETMVALYSIEFDSGTLLKSMLNDIQELEQNGKCHSVGIVQIYNHHELYDEPIVKVKYVGGVISNDEWKKIPVCFLNKPVESAYMFTTTIKDGNYHIAITVK